MNNALFPYTINTEGITYSIIVCHDLKLNKYIKTKHHFVPSALKIYEKLYSLHLVNPVQHWDQSYIYILDTNLYKIHVLYSRDLSYQTFTIS